MDDGETRPDTGSAGRDAEVPRAFTWSDAWLLASLAIRTNGDSWIPLWSVIDTMDFLQHLAPTYDEVSYGLPRLRAAGLVAIDGTGDQLRLRVTQRSRELDVGPNASRQSASAIQESIRSTIGAHGRLDADEDRSLGRLEELDESDWDGLSGGLSRDAGRDLDLP